jgi:hypothetical protein
MKYGKTFTEALREVSKLQEDGHTDVASAVRQCKTAIEDASEMLSKLQGMNPEGDLPSWWMNKIAIAANSMNKLRDYLLVPSTTTEDFADINRKRAMTKDRNSDRQKGSQHIPPIDKDNAPGVKIAKIRAQDDDPAKEAVKKLENEIQMLKIELENEKNKTVRPEPNPVTGEVPLRTGLAGALLDKNAKNKLKDVIDRVKKDKKVKVGGKTKVEVDPDFDVGQYSDGTKVPTSNLG